MNREKAIEELKLIAKVTMWNDRREAVEMAIEALQAEPVCEHFYKGYCSRFEDGCFRQCQAEPVKSGEWHKMENEEMEITGYYCSVCDMPTNEPTNYCGNCGAKMERREP